MLRRTRLAVATRPGFPRERLDGGAGRARATPSGCSSSRSSRCRSPRAICGGSTRRGRRRRRAVRGRRDRPAARGSMPRRPGYTSARLSPLEQARRIAALAQDKLARDVVILDMQPVCAYTDYFVVAHGRQRAPDEGDLGRGARPPEARPRPAATLGRRRARRRPGSSATTSTSCCTSSRPRRASSTASRICGTTSRTRPSKQPRPDGHVFTARRTVRRRAYDCCQC